MTNVDYAARAVAVLHDLYETPMADPHTPEAIVCAHTVLVALRAAETMHRQTAAAEGLPIDDAALTASVRRWPGAAGYGT